ncbi:G1/S-specific cyclin pas1 [Pseudocercospora fuligena]|uniref:G1/S-specific cyclin pas1 n=1 Tax=Pseudocercospora fuligena TaxID=685502 RepID=A0A8H6VEF2_9PEZI|nr:G1/S-specific cyclin pas1 [Pseudocercospora fuligena]
MNSEYIDRGSDGLSSLHEHHGPYEPSIASSASSSQVSVFSDTLSASSSIASSVSDDFRYTHDDARERDRICAQAQLRFQAQTNNQQLEEPAVLGNLLKGNGQCMSYADVTSVPAPQRQHPRRTSLSRNQRPPPLVRQRDRKINFVDNLVGSTQDSATQMVEVIWPLSIVPCQSEASGRGVLPLRTYIEETLRRSRTSYSTLQVALYYLVLIRPHVPKRDFTMEQTVDSPAERALMCGRRMFLAALILASKYLQDRNYSAKAWSKMSGLNVCEINTNERTFLSKVDWKLHIPKPIFEKWQEVVLRYTPQPPPSPSWNMPSATSTWKRMVPLLTPELDNLPMVESKVAFDTEPAFCYDMGSPMTPTPANMALKAPPLDSTSHESTPTAMSTLASLPRFLEPKPDIAPPTPGLARMGPLPTPNMTPSSTATSTPAVSACGSRRPSMCSAMALAQKTSMNRCIFDSNPAGMASFEPRYTATRRPSIMSIGSTGSSPESMVSDNSRLSRSSSISSVSTASSYSSMAPQRACLARQATCRNAGLLPSKLVKEETEGSAIKPIIIEDDVEMVSSPVMADFSISEKVLHTPHRHSRASKHVGQNLPAAAADKSRKRGRPHGGNRRSELQEEVRYLLNESYEDSMELDDRDVSPTPAASCATNMVGRYDSYTIMKEAQPPASISRRESNSRVPVQKNEGKKRTCCSIAGPMSISPVPLYGEVV